MTTNDKDRDTARLRRHNARVRLFQILCALDSQKGACLEQAEIESRFEELFVLPGSEPGTDEVGEISAEVLEESENELVLFDDFRETCARAVQMRKVFPEVDRMVDEASPDWKISRMTVVDRTAIRLALCEAFIDKSVPVGAAVNEAVEIAREFSGEQSVRFVNGVLGRVVRAQQQ